MKKTFIALLALNLLLVSSGCTIDLDLGYDTDTKKEEAKPDQTVTTGQISDYAKEAPVSEATPSEEKEVTPQLEVPFKLTSGKPPYADPKPIVYEGLVTLKGWIENVPAYVPGTETDHFTVAEESVPNMPSDLLHKDNRYYQLTGISEAQMAELKKATKTSPATIVVDKLTVVQEGTPSLNFVEIKK